MSYTIEVTKELFLVTKQYSGRDDKLHIVMSKKEVQEELKRDFGTIEKIEKLVIRPDGYASKKYFLPNNQVFFMKEKSSLPINQTPSSK